MQRFAAILCIATATTLLSACGASVPPAATSVALAEGASVMVFHRGIVDFVVSALKGEDCSMVHVDRGQDYCREPAPPAAPPPYCTRTLGVANCWASPQLFKDPPRGLADGPWALTPRQEANRVSPF